MATADEAKKSADDKEPKTAGQRLAAAKAAKAAAKAAKRGREAELRESKALKQAEAAGDWARRNRKTLYVALGLVVLVIAGATAWSIHSESTAQEASGVLWDAVETARAEIAPAADPDSDIATYGSAEDRAERAADRYAKVVQQYPSTPAAVWALLGEANAQYQLGNHDDARQTYQRALSQGGDDPVVAWRSLEGIGFTYEAEEAWDEAIERFQQLGNEADGAWKDVSDYHLARMHLAKGDEERAKEILRELVERLRGEREGEPEMDYVLAQAEIRLQALDPSLVPRETSPFPGGGMGMGGMGGAPGGAAPGGGGGGGPGGMGDLSPEQLQKLIDQLQKQGGMPGGGAPPGGGE